MKVTRGPRGVRPSSDETPTPLRSTLIWLVVGVAAAFASVEVAIRVPSTLPRVFGALVLAGVVVLALMLASEGAERCLAGRYSAWRQELYWLSVSVVALAVVVVFGAAASLAIGDGTGFWTVIGSFLADLVVGGVGGAVAVGLVLAFGAVLGGCIYRLQSHLKPLERADRWHAPQSSERWPWGHVSRGVWLGATGLVASALSTALITTLTTNHAGSADSPTTVAHGFLTVVVPLLCWFIGARAGWALFRRWRTYRRRTVDVEPHLRLRHGTHGTALAVCLIVVWVWVVSGSLQSSTERRLWSHTPRAGPSTVAATNQQWSGDSSYLAEQFEPRLWLTSRENWSPTSVRRYRQHSGDPTHATGFCRQKGCYEIRKPGCDVANPPRGCAESGLDDPALYYRYFDSSDLGLHATAASTSWRLIEYWIFYNYDSLTAGAITQWHQADWEQVSVLVQRRGATVTPREVAFSEHCYGAVVPAARVEWDGSHPKVYVAQGSHANYPRPVSVPVRELRCSLGLQPRYLGVAGLFFAPAFDGASIELPLAYMIGLRDRTGTTRPTPPLRLVRLVEGTPPVKFTGAWGLDNNLTFWVSPRVRTGPGPGAPQTQDPWMHPFCAMLMSQRWLSPGRRVTEPGVVCK